MYQNHCNCRVGKEAEVADLEGEADDDHHVEQNGHNTNGVLSK